MRDPAEDKSEYRDRKMAEYRRTHDPEGYGLGSAQYPDNREGRRALARSWKRQPPIRRTDRRQANREARKELR